MRPDERAVAVTGLGLITAAGTGVGECWENVVAAERPPLERCVELAGLRCDFMYCVDRPDLQEALGEDAGRLMDRFTQITLLAAREAAADTRSP
jgi:3-oxoacyl-[acyl-carrier-protein] synthase II